MNIDRLNRKSCIVDYIICWQQYRGLIIGKREGNIQKKNPGFCLFLRQIDILTNRYTN